MYNEVIKPFHVTVDMLNVSEKHGRQLYFHLKRAITILDLKHMICQKTNLPACRFLIKQNQRVCIDDQIVNENSDFSFFFLYFGSCPICDENAKNNRIKFHVRG